MPMLNDLCGEVHMHRSGVGSPRYKVRCIARSTDPKKCCIMLNFIRDSPCLRTEGPKTCR